VPVAADPQQLDVDAARVAERRLVGLAGRQQVVGMDVGPADGAGREVDVRLQLPGDERPV
jgi:hypothetical protein